MKGHLEIILFNWSTNSGISSTNPWYTWLKNWLLFRDFSDWVYDFSGQIWKIVASLTLCLVLSRITFTKIYSLRARIISYLFIFTTQHIAYLLDYKFSLIYSIKIWVLMSWALCYTLEIWLWMAYTLHILIKHITIR